MNINLDRLNEITGGDETVNQMLLDLFQKTADKCLAALKSNAADNSENAKKLWHEAVHELKGAAGNLGFDALFELCKKYESANPTPALQAEAVGAISALLA